MDNITILLLRVESQWAIKNESSKEYSHLELIGVQHECDNINMMSLVMFSDRWKSVTIIYHCQEVIITYVSHISDMQKFNRIFFNIPIYSDYHFYSGCFVFWYVTVSIIMYIMCCILMCLHKCHYIILYFWHVLIDDGMPDLIWSLFDFSKLFT